MKNRHLEIFLAIIALVACVFVLDRAEERMKAQVSIAEAKIDMRNYQKHSFLDGYEGLPILYLDGSMDKISREDKVKLKYRFEGKSGKLKCGLQGRASVYFPKKNYTVSEIEIPFDIGWGLRNKYTLKADYIDCSHARNIVGAKLWGQIVKSRSVKNDKLQSLPNGGAVDGFPIYLVLNGKYHGIYNLCLSKDKNLFAMTKGDKECILVIKNPCDYATLTKEISLDGLEKGDQFQVKHGVKNKHRIVDSINRVVKICKSENNVEFEKCIDVDSAVDYYIHACMIGNADGVDNNYLLSTYDGEKWFFTPYDMDLIFGNNVWWNGGNYTSPNDHCPTFTNYRKKNVVMYMVYKFHKDKLKSRYAQLRRGILSEANVMNMVYNYMAPISEVMKQEEYKLYPQMPGTNTNTAAQIVEWYRLRCIAMDKEMASL